MYQINEAAKKYYLGGTQSGAVIFWSVNENKKIINGKSINYLLTGKRDKSNHYSIKHLYTSENGYKQSLFGLHLINEVSKTICIVESEKTAVIASIQYPQFIWLASGASNGLTEEKLKPIKNRNIVIIPDCDKAGREAFTKAIKRLEHNNNKVKYHDIDPNLTDGTDLADLILSKNV